MRAGNNIYRLESYKAGERHEDEEASEDEEESDHVPNDLLGVRGVLDEDRAADVVQVPVWPLPRVHVVVTVVSIVAVDVLGEGEVHLLAAGEIEFKRFPRFDEKLISNALNC